MESIISRKAKSALSLIDAFVNWPTTLTDHAGLRRAPYICRLRNGLRFHVRPGTDDGRILFDVFAKRCYRPKALRPGGTVIDIGANIGAFSLLAAQHGAVVHAYEPHPVNVAIFEANRVLNGLTGIHLKPQAVAAEAGMAALYIPDDDGFVGRFSLYPGRGTRTIEVPVISTAAMFASLPPGDIDCFKLDCQGSEYDILYAAGPDNLRRVREILVECEAFPPDQPKYSVSAITDYLTGLGFRIEAVKNLLHARRDA